MEKTYNPKNIEQPLYDFWEKKGYFQPNGNLKKDSYCIMIPPPNVTGTLHMGHAFQQTIMDILVRYQRMQGKNTLWQVGTDHAGIATQIVVEKKIAEEEGKVRNDYGRDAFIKKIWQWKAQSRSTITYQMRRLGNSVDWTRERFTMDTGLSTAVTEAFVRLYQEKLIYRGKRLVNWDPKLCTAISDLEVEHRELKGSMWYLRYPLADGLKTSDNIHYLVVATTRPETMLGDTGVAVNPEDPRYNFLIGQYILLPIVGRRVPIIADKYVHMNQGTGCVKITPAHDFNDYEVGKNHKLPMINIFTSDGNIRQKAEVFDTSGKITDLLSIDIPERFRGLERFSARDAIVAEFSRLNLLQEVKTHHLTVPYSNRSGEVIEPMLTNQWYLHTAPLAKVAIQAVEQGEIQFVPEQYKNIYFSWMHNIQDWCISRQLWWGHRIPAWYDDQREVYVGHDEVEIRRKHHLTEEIKLCQDDDVLDTWFSSGIWTFSTLGWPENTESLRTFHPTNLIVSGFDIIFFWIARMIMLTMHFVKDKNSNKPQVPFKTVYITGLIRDEEGDKMSKSQGNIIDPIDIMDGISLPNLIKKRTTNMMLKSQRVEEEICKRTEKYFPHGIESYGADALRFTLTSLASRSRDINWNMQRLDGYRKFCNKLWNASRFVLKNSEDQDFGLHGGEKILSLADRWIAIAFNQTVKLFRDALDNYRFDIAARTLYEFTWNQFCDWYLELSKSVIISGNEAELRGTRYTLVHVLEALLRLAHPVIPFITETLWQKVKVLTGKQDETIMLQSFPIFDENLHDADVLIDFEWIKQLIIAVRTTRIKMNIAQRKPLEIFICNASYDVKTRIHTNLNMILTLTKLDNITILPIGEETNLVLSSSISYPLDGAELLIIKKDVIDKQTELDV